MDDRLIGPRLKVRRAEKHIEDLEIARKEFVTTDPYLRVREEDPKTGDLVYKTKVQPHTAEGLRDLSVIAGDAVHNLRSALDLLAWQLVDAHSGKPGDSTAFPVWRTEGQFLGNCPGYMRGASPGAIRVLKSLEPYKGGNEALWRLHRLDATDKHRLLLAVGATQGPAIWDVTIGRTGHRVKMRPDGPTVLLEDGEEIFRVRAAHREYFESQPEPQFTLLIALREFERTEALDLRTTIRDLASTTTEIIDLFASVLYPAGFDDLPF